MLQVGDTERFPQALCSVRLDPIFPPESASMVPVSELWRRIEVTRLVQPVKEVATCHPSAPCCHHYGVGLRYDSKQKDSVLRPRSGELRTQKLKSHLVRTQSLNVLPLKPGVVRLRLLPGISSLLISTLAVHSPAFFPKSLPIFFLRWLWLTPVPV